MLERETANFIIDVHALVPQIVSTALTVLGAILILLIGLWLSGRASLVVNRMLARAPNFDAMLRSFFGSLARYLILAVTVLAVLSQFGIQTASLVAVFGAAGLAVGLALQGTLSHLAAGVMLLIVRPFRSGHKVQVGGSIGTVTDLTLFWTELMTDDKVQIIVPNAGIWGQPLRNFSIYPSPAVSSEVRFRIAEDADLDTAIELVRTIVGSHRRVLADPAPSVLLDHSADDNALEIVASFSTSGDEAAVTKSDLIKAVHTELDNPSVSRTDKHDGRSAGEASQGVGRNL
jgi:small conductance mechanosensitive channel